MIWAGWIYVALIAVLVCFQACMALGAPWGHLANGGRWRGRLPAGMRVAAIGQGAILIFMGTAMAARAGIAPDLPSWTFWVALAITVLTTIANLATPSRAERMLWGPVTVVLTLCALRLAFG
ncbi:hypothetical protein ALP8811_00938 [Aliiroseovarius pelagivivens]|uniref:Uncharacterized protein n=1 Tax=Aliiroseovarius pelagivivens TaxID=1639690 RepID=A0A2R8AIS1_9RHOB|nr:hypothetical protein [Aliiroseovarius pelagivivens]SPF75943.1 hypothetical protein ALP8811_00938 [Aliiroseovarius pelagivivens]